MIYQYGNDDAEILGGYWFYLRLPKSELVEIRQWCKTNLGLATKAIKNHISDENPRYVRWKPEDALRNWSILSGNGSTMFLILWKKESAALFMVSYDTTPIEEK